MTMMISKWKVFIYNTMYIYVNLEQKILSCGQKIAVVLAKLSCLPTAGGKNSRSVNIWLPASLNIFLNILCYVNKWNICHASGFLLT